MSIVVEKKRVGEDGEYNLSGERYRENKARDLKFPVAKIGEICTINPRKSELVDLSPDSPVSFVSMVDLNESRMLFRPMQEKMLAEVLGSYTYFADDDVLLARVTPCFENGKAGIARGLLNGIGFGSSEFIVLRCGDGILPEWIYFCVTHPLFRNWAVHQMTGTGGLQRVPRSSVAGFQVPLPPLSVQQEIVAEIERYQKVIDGARAVVDNYRPHIMVDPEWPLVALGDICSVDGMVTNDIDPTLPYLGADSIESNTGKILKTDSVQAQGMKGPLHEFTGQRLLYSKIRPYLNKLAIVDLNGYCSSDMYPLLPDRAKIDIAYLATYMLSEEFNDSIRHYYERASIPKINRSQLFKVGIPLPPLEIQKLIAAELDAEQTLIEANRELIHRFQGKIRSTIGRVWEEAPTEDSKDQQPQS